MLSAEEIKGIKKGDKVQYSFKLKKTDKQMGKVMYIPAHPIFDKDAKAYVYELEATIDTQELYELHTGMIGRASVVTGEEPIWKFILILTEGYINNKYTWNVHIVVTINHKNI